MHATAEPLRGITGREVGAAKLLVTLDHIEGQVTPEVGSRHRQPNPLGTLLGPTPSPEPNLSRRR